MADIKLESLRSLDDFVLDTTRFEVPKSQSWGRRVKANLIYYQTNYFILFAVLFLGMGIFRPNHMLIGMASTLAFGFVIHYVNDRPGLTLNIRQNHPLLCLATFGVIVYIALGYFFLVAILLPVLVIFLHASMRLRNLSNKIANQAEKLSANKSPMGIMLEVLGIGFEFLDD